MDDATIIGRAVQWLFGLAYRNSLRVSLYAAINVKHRHPSRGKGQALAGDLLVRPAWPRRPSGGAFRVVQLRMRKLHVWFVLATSTCSLAGMLSLHEFLQVLYICLPDYQLKTANSTASWLAFVNGIGWCLLPRNVSLLKTAILQQFQDGLQTRIGKFSL